LERERKSCVKRRKGREKERKRPSKEKRPLWRKRGRSSRMLSSAIERAAMLQASVKWGDTEERGKGEEVRCVVWIGFEGKATKAEFGKGKET